MNSFETKVLSRICEYMRMEIASGRCVEMRARERYNAGLRGLIEGLMLTLNPEYVCDIVSKARQIVNKEMGVENDTE